MVKNLKIKLQELLGRMAISKEGEELGKIIRIDKLVHSIHKRLVPHAMIEIRYGFRKKVVVPLDVQMIKNVTVKTAKFNISKYSFEKMVDREKVIVEDRKGNMGYIDRSAVSRNTMTRSSSFKPKRKS